MKVNIDLSIAFRRMIQVAAFVLIGFSVRNGDDRALFVAMFLAMTTQLSIMNSNLKAIGNNARMIAEHDTHNLLFKKDQK